jgi:hypothetical protein
MVQYPCSRGKMVRHADIIFPQTSSQVVYVYMPRICIYVYTHTHTRTYRYAHTHTHLHTHTHVYIHTVDVHRMHHTVAVTVSVFKSIYRYTHYPRLVKFSCCSIAWSTVATYSSVECRVKWSGSGSLNNALTVTVSQ